MDNKEVNEEEVTETVSESKTVTPIYTSLEKADIDNGDLAKAVIVSSSKESMLLSHLEEVGELDIDDVEKELTKDEMVCVGINYESRNKSLTGDAKHSLINETNDFVNKVTYGDKDLGINPVKIKATGKLTGSNAVAKFTARLGIGNHTTVTLWHSGFSLVLAPPKESEIINLRYSIAKAEHKLGHETNNFVYSNYGVVINKLLVEFIMDHVIASSLQLPEGASYIDYIKITDLETLAIAQATAMHPNGYPITSTCKNTMIIEDNKPLCDFTAFANIIPSNLLWVNRKALTTECLSHISKTSPGSHTLDDVLNYQNNIAVNKPTETVIKDSNGTDVKFDIVTPTIKEYIDSGELWVNKVILNATELFSDSDSEDIRNGKIDSIVSASILNKYNSYINTIKLDDAFVDDMGSITDVLEVMSSDTVIGNALLKTIIAHIDNGYISLVATYNFDCPTCKAAGRDYTQFEGHIDGFKEFIPLNAVEHFFDLSALMFTKIENR